MGQILNIEIKEKGKLLANAYYHWSAYTGSSLKLIETILDNIDNINYENNILRAIKLLETTGAGLTDEEQEYAFKYISDVETFKNYVDRNEGLIAVSIRGMKETRNWAEHKVIIDLYNKTVNFDTIFIYSKEEYVNYYHSNEDIKYSDLPIYKINFKNIQFEIFKEIKNLIMMLIEMNTYYIRINGKSDVYSFIA